MLDEGPSAEAEADARHGAEIDRRGLNGKRLLAYYLQECDRWGEVVGIYDQMIAAEPRTLAATGAPVGWS